MHDASTILLVPAIVTSFACLTYSAMFVFLVVLRGRTTPSIIDRPARRKTLDAGPGWIVVIATLESGDDLEACVAAAVAATSSADVTIVIAMDDRDGSSRDRSRRAVERGAGSIDLLDLDLGFEGPTVTCGPPRVICVPTGEMPRSRSTGGKAPAVNLAVSRVLWSYTGGPGQGELRASYLLCVDADERLSREGFQRLQAVVERHPEATLIQAPKRDIPTTSSLFARAFSAAYVSWFKWEAGWPASGSSRAAGSSYYGSMAAIKLSPELLRVRRVVDPDVEKAKRIELFPEDCEVEDYAFSLSLSSREQTLLLSGPIGVGCAPPDMASLFAMWSRWARGNISASAKGFRALCLQPEQTVGQRLARLYHACSWISPLPLGVLPFALVGALASGSRFAVPTLLLISLALVGEHCRRLLPAAPAATRDLMLRLPTDMLLWPVAMYAILGAALGFRSPFPMSTPRVAGSQATPAWIWGAFVAEAVALIGGFMLIPSSSHRAIDILAYLLVSGPVCVGMYAAWRDRPSGSKL